MSDDDEMAAAVQAVKPLLPMTPDELARWLDPAALRASALWYASRGWPVFPVTPGAKTPMTRHGFKDASTDRRDVERWWGATPLANIGTPSGVSFDVIDIDAPDGFATFAEWESDLREAGHALPPIIAIASTGSGGRHLLVRAAAKGNGAALGDGLDYRGRGGYIVLPPSRLASGGFYSWVKAP